MYSYGPPHIAKQKQDDQLEHTYSSYVKIRNVALKTCQKRWMIGRSDERGSGISVLAARHDDDDADDITENYLYYEFTDSYHHHHHVAPLSRISITISHHPSISSIASGLHPVSAQSCCTYVLAGHPAFARPCEGYVTHEFVPTSPAVSHMSGSSNLDSFCDGW